MRKESGFAPLLVIIPVVLLLLTGSAVGAYYYAQNGELPIYFGNQQSTETESSPLPSPVSSPIATPVALATPTPTPVSTPSPSSDMQIIVEEDPLKPNCGIMFQTSFEIPVEQGDDSLAISKKAISQYLNQVKVSPAKDTLVLLSSEERAFAEDLLQKKILSKDLNTGQKITVPCEDIEKSCIAAQKAL